MLFGRELFHTALVSGIILALLLTFHSSTLVLVAPFVILTNTYFVARFHVGKINYVRDDFRVARDTEIFPSVNRTLKKHKPLRTSAKSSPLSCRDLGVASSQLFVLLLDFACPGACVQRR